MSTTTNAGLPAKVQVTVSGIKEDLNNGLTRDDIGLKYELTKKDVKDLFKHPKLKGLKTKVAPRFVLIDDEEQGAPAETEPVAAEEPVGDAQSAGETTDNADGPNGTVAGSDEGEPVVISDTF